MTKDLLFWLWYLYAIPGLIVLILFPFRNVFEDYRDNRHYNTTWSMYHYLTYNHLANGVLLALIPVVNMFVICDAGFDIITMSVADLRNKKVFKEPLSDC